MTRSLFLALALLAAPAAGAGELRGTVGLGGEALPPKALEVTKDKGTCGQQVPDESLLVANGRLRNAVVTVKGAPRPGPVRAALDQQRCRFAPHVQAVPVGSTLEILNGDPILHNAHGWLGQATAFNLAMPLKGQKVPKRLDRAGLVKVRCDVHAWMSAYVVVTDGPSAISGEDGAYAIPNLPPGAYEVTAWHERLGERTARVTVPAEGQVVQDFAFAR
jgi:plastocyanin